MDWNNPDERKKYFREYARQWRKKPENAERIEKYMRSWYQQNAQKSRELSRAYYANHTTQANRIKASYRQRMRDIVIMHYGGYKCACCGETTPEFLGVDHINGNGNKHRREIGNHLCNWIVKNNFPPGFQILCHNCNMAKGFYGICPHQRGKPNETSQALPSLETTESKEAYQQTSFI